MKMSVAMCTYNGARYLPEQLESIATQRRPPDELVVCDDHSSDTTLEIVASFAASASFPVHLYVNEQNLGSTKNFERAIGLSTGDVIALSDQDDIWLPEKLGVIEETFRHHPEVGLVFTDAEVVDDEGKSAGYSLWEKLSFGNAERERVRRGVALRELLLGATVTGATMAFRSRFRELILPIPSDFSLIHDAWITLLVAGVSEVLPIPQRLVQYRQHAGQQVGALERKSAARAQLSDPASVRAARHRENSYLEALAITQSMYRRLNEKSHLFDSRQILSGLEERIAHLSARANLPSRRLSRLRDVLRELLSRRYHLYSNGVYSAIKDLLA
jgi:glycosyltransferase involved in cell wall biosynthesis